MGKIQNVFLVVILLLSVFPSHGLAIGDGNELRIIQSDESIIEDPQLEESIREQLDLKEGPLTVEDLETLKGISATSQGISSLKGLEW